MKVNALKVGYHLTKLAEIIEDDLTSPVGNQFFAQRSVLEKRQEHPLDGVLSPPLLILISKCPLRSDSSSDGRIQRGLTQPQFWKVPRAPKSVIGYSRAIRHEVEQLAGCFGLRGIEEIRHPCDDEGYFRCLKRLSDLLSVGTNATEQYCHVRPREAALRSIFLKGYTAEGLDGFDDVLSLSLWIVECQRR